MKTLEFRLQAVGSGRIGTASRLKPELQRPQSGPPDSLYALRLRRSRSAAIWRSRLRKAFRSALVSLRWAGLSEPSSSDSEVLAAGRDRRTVLNSVSSGSGQLGLAGLAVGRGTPCGG